MYGNVRDKFEKSRDSAKSIEAVVKQANADRLRTPIPPQGTIGKKILPDPPQTTTLDPETLQEAGDTTTETRNPAEDIAHQMDAIAKQARSIAAEEATKIKADPLQKHLSLTRAQRAHEPSKRTLKLNYRTRRSSQRQRTRQLEFTPQKET